jgi:hypothetical protein
MKNLTKIFRILSILCLLLLVTPFPVSANSYEGFQQNEGVILGDYTLASGDTNNGDMVFLGGNIIIEDGATVNGSVVIFGCTVQLDGKINGDFIAFGGTGSVGDSANISGSVVSLGSDLDISDDATIIGGTVFELDDSIHLPSINISPEDIQPENIPDLVVNTSPGLEFLRKLFSTAFSVLAVAALGLLIGILFPNHLKKTAKTIVNEPLKSGVLGLLTVFIAPVVLIILSITIILLPITLIAIFALGIMMLYGWVAVGYEIGLRIATSAKVNWEPSIISGIGTLILSTTAALVGMIPCIGFLIYPIVLFVGLGGVLISQFGHREVKSAQTVAAPVELPAGIPEDGMIKTPSDDDNNK